MALRTEASLAALTAIATQVPDAVVGAGTVRQTTQLAAVRRAGARFAVSPGTTPSLVGAAQAADLPFLPGVQTVAEAMAMMEQGFEVLKFFPAAASGGRGLVGGRAACRRSSRTETVLARPGQRCS